MVAYRLSAYALVFTLILFSNPQAVGATSIDSLPAFTPNASTAEIANLILPEPTHHWAFDEGAGTAAADSVGGLNGILQNGASFTAGATSTSGSALLFGNDGGTSRDNVALGGTQGQTTWSVSAWFRQDANTTTNAYAFILESTSTIIFSRFNGTNTIAISDSSGNNAIVFDKPLSNGEWTHIVLTANGTNYALYVNGVLFSTKTGSTFPLPLSYIGDNDTNNNSFIGATDDLQMWNGTALDATQVQELYDFYFTQPNIRLVHVDPSIDQVTIKNFGADAVDISDYRLCSLFDYTLNGLASDMSIVAGSLKLAAGATVRLSGFALDDTAADLGLYFASGDFTDPTAMADFMQWGSASNGRESVADTKGIWTAGDFISGGVPFSYSGDGTQNGVSFWQSVPLTATISLDQNIQPQSGIFAGDPITYTLTLSNTGPGTAFGIMLADDLPQGVSSATAIANGITLTETSSAPSFVWDVSDLAPNASGEIVINTFAPAVGGDITNTVRITYTDGFSTHIVESSIIVPVASIDVPEPFVAFATSGDLIEGDNGTITAALDVSATWDVTVTLIFTDVTATGGGVDYSEPMPAEIVIPAGAISATVPFSTTDDGIIEGDETFDVAIGATVGATVGAGVGATNAGTLSTITIIDKLDLVINEIDYDQAGADNAEFIEIKNSEATTVTLDGYEIQLINGNGVVAYATVDLASYAIPPQGYFVLCSDPNTVENCDVEFSTSLQNGPDAVTLVNQGAIVDTVGYGGGVPGYTEGVSADADPAIEQIGLSRLPDGADTESNNADFSPACITPGAPNSTLASNCGPPVVMLSATPTITEGNSALITATLDITFSQDVTVTLLITDVTVDNTDYATTTDTIVVPSGQFAASISVDTIDDARDEADETFQVGIGTVGGGIDASTPLTITVLDNDEPAITLRVDSPVLEGEPATITATLDITSFQTVTVTLAFTDVTATGGGVDYSEPTPAEIVIPVGEISASIAFSTTDDGDVEADETFDVAVASAIGAIDASGLLSVTILNDDLPLVGLAITTDVLEGDSGTVTATLDVSVTAGVTVTLIFTDVTATGGGVDYSEPTPAEIVIPAGDISASVPFSTTDDADVEADETFDVSVASAIGAIDASGIHSVTILNDDLPLVDLAVTADVLEGDSGTVTATLDVSTTSDVTVTLAFTDVTATGGGVDYSEPTPAKIVIPAGDISASVAFSTTDDADVEADETFDVSVASAIGAIDASGILSVTILNDDLPLVDLAVTADVLEGDSGTVTATLDVSTFWDVSVTLVVTDVTATGGGIDYSGPTPAEIVIPAGDISASIPFSTTDDADVEADETFDVAVASAIGAIDVSGILSVTILNDDLPLVDLAVTADVLEGDSGTVTATLDVSVTADITVTLAFTDVTATGGGVDYSEPTPAEIVIPAGDISASVPFSTTDDADVEADETFDVSVASVIGAIDASGIHSVTILNDDLPLVDLAVATDVLEGDSGTITATLDVSVTADVTVTLAFTDVTATGGGVDYSEPAPAEIVIPAGEISASVPFSTTDDADVEADEIFDVAVASAIGAIDASGILSVTILNDDLPLVDLAVTADVLEGDSGTITATLDVSVTWDVTVGLTFVDNTATGGVDYTEPTPAEIVIPAGAISASVSFDVVDDREIEGDETFIVDIGGTNGATDVSIPSGVTILDNDEPNVDLAITADVLEGDSGIITATLDVSITSDVTVTLVFTDVTASGGGVDYHAPAPAEIVIPAGDISASISFSTTDDADVEADETFDVAVASVIGAIDVSSILSVTILNDDLPKVDLRLTAEVVEGDSGTITATLESLLTGNVTVTLVFTDDTATGGGVDYTEPVTAVLVIPAGENSATMLVSTTDDQIDEIDERFAINISAVSGAANNGTQQTMTILDNDTAGVALTDANDGDTPLEEGDVAVDEANSAVADQFGVRLETEPADGEVVVTVGTDGQCTVNPPTLTFTAANFSIQQTVDVSAVDDAVDETDPHDCAITLGYSGDAAYVALPDGTVNAAVGDDDLLGVNLTDPNNADAPLATGAILVDEANTTPDQFGLALDSAPGGGDVIVAVRTDGQCAALPTSLTFTAANFDIEQLVAVAAVDDAVDETSTHTCTVVLNYASSLDAAYAALIDSSVSVLVGDNDNTGVLLTDPNNGDAVLTVGALLVDEASTASDQFALTLDAQPAGGDVLVAITTDGQCSSSPTALTFNATDFDVQQTVDVMAVDDALDEADPHNCAITLDYSNSTDGTYAALTSSTLSAAVGDDDSAGASLLDPNSNNVPLTNGAVAVDEATPSVADQFGLVLDTEPVAGNVAVTLSADSQCRVSPATLAFAAADATTPQVVDVTAVDDALTEATPHHCLIVLDYSGSTDPAYAGMSNGLVSVAVSDNDSIGIALLDPNNANAPLANGALAVSEANTTPDQFVVALQGAPTAGTVAVAITTDGQCNATPSALTFTATDAATAQTVDVAAIDDNDVEPDPHSCVVTLDYSGSTDAAYAALANATANVFVGDDDTSQGGNSLAIPSSLVFVAQVGAANPPSQRVTLQYPGGGVGWSFSSWVSAAPSWGANSTLLMDVSVDAQGRAEGTYQGTLVVTLGAEQVTIPIELRVIAQTELLVNRGELVFGGTQAEPAPAAQTVRIESNDLSTLNWTATVDQPWVSLSATSGTTPASLFVGVGEAKMNDVGTHHATITITDDASSDGATSHTIAVQLNVIATGANFIELAGLEVTQGVQNLLNEMPLVQNKATFVRAHVRSRSGETFDNVTAKLTGTRAGTALGELVPANAGGSVNIGANPDRAQLNDSFLFELPPSWRTGNVVLTFAGISHPIDCAESASTPNDCQAAVTFEAVPAFPIKLLNGSDTVSGYQFTTRPADQLGTIQSIKAYLPVDVVDWSVSPTTLQYAGDRDNGQVLNDVRSIWTNDGSPATHYYGLFAKYSASGAPQVNGISGIASLGGFVGMGDYTTWGESLNVHELGHNLSFGHSPCGTTGGLDPNFPYADARMSSDLTGDSAYYGFHIYQQTVYPPTAKDVMSYCSQKWIADWTYKQALDVIKSKYTTAQAASIRTVAAAGQKVIVIQGAVSNDGQTGTIQSLFQTLAQSDIPEPMIGDYTLRLEDAAGEMLAGYQFGAEEQLDHKIGALPGTESGYNLIVAYPEALTRIVLLHQGVVLAVREASASKPTVSLISPADGAAIGQGTVEIEWQAEDADGDALTYNVDYSNDGGQSWHELVLNWRETKLTVDTKTLPGGNRSMVRIFANDGLHAAMAQTQTPFSVPNNAPSALILAPGAHRLFVGEQQIILEGTGIDQEDGRLTGESLVWRSNRNGILGTGETLVLSADNLAEGKHTITLEATDRNGNSSIPTTLPTSAIPNESAATTGASTESSVVLIQVSRDRMELPTTLAVAPAALDFVTTVDVTEALKANLSIRNLGEGQMNWTLTDSSNIFRLAMQSGAESADFAVEFDVPQTAGVYSGILLVESAEAVNGSVEVPYTIFVGPAPNNNNPNINLYLPMVVRE